MNKKLCTLCLFSSLCLLFMFSSCNSSPAESLAINYINNIGKKRDNLFKVKSLKKTNGATVNPNQYVMEYDYEIECLKSNGGAFMFAGSGKFPCNDAGEIVKGKGFVYFQKTENGWMPLDHPDFESWFNRH